MAVTTRFPTDALGRYRAEPDASEWLDRLEVHGLDFRRLADVLEAIEHFRQHPLDILVNNAAQTVWHPPSYYANLVAREQADPQIQAWTSSTGLASPGTTALDRVRINSWVMRLEEVPPVEMVECQVVNAIVPFLLCSQLQPSFLRSPHPERFIVNVAALEGQFSRAVKAARHPHTNMAKAALNMLTRTSAEAYAEKGIFMVSVDPGWVSHEGPPAVIARAKDAGFHPPLDRVDSAARILDPVARGLRGTPVYGVLLKDFAEQPW